jgi:hypothetical protein
VLELLRRRHLDEEDMFKAGFVHGVPLALVGLGAVLYWAGPAAARGSKDCRSATCAYIPGTGTALLAYVVSVGLVGWLVAGCQCRHLTHRPSNR